MLLAIGRYPQRESPTRNVRSDERISEILQRGRRLAVPPTSEHSTPARSDSERTSIRSGFRVDGGWKYQRFP